MLLSGKSLAEIEQAARLSRTSLWKLRSTEAFRHEYERAKTDMLTAAVGLLHSFAMDFVKALHMVATDPKAHANARASAAREGLAAIFRANELLNLSERLAKLETERTLRSDGETPTFEHVPSTGDDRSSDL